MAVDAQKAKDPLISPIKTTRRGSVSTTLTAPAGLKGQSLRPGAVVVTENGVAQDASVVRLPAEQLEVVLVVDTSVEHEGGGADIGQGGGQRLHQPPSRPCPGRPGVVRQHGERSPARSWWTATRPSRPCRPSRPKGSTALYDAVRLAPTSSPVAPTAGAPSSCCRMDATRSAVHR